MIPPRNRAVALLLAAFSLGLLLGGVSLVLATKAGKAEFVWDGGRRGGPGHPGGMSGGRAARLQRQIGFSATTKDSIDAIYQRGSVVIDSIGAKIRPQVDSLFEIIRPAVEARRQQSRTEIRALLTAPQRERYDSIVRADDENRRRMREQGRGRGPR